MDSLYRIYNSTSTPLHVRQFVARTIRSLNRVSPPNAANARGIVAANAGGKIQRADSAAVIVPPNALSRDIAITVSTATFHNDAEESAKQARMEARGLKASAAAVEFGPEGTAFSAPVTISLPYDPVLLAQQRISEDSLQVHYWNPDASDWQPLASTLDRGRRLVTAQTSHFSLYQVLGTTGAASAAPLAAPDSTFALHAAYVFPNPARGASSITLRIQPGLADSVEAHIYDLTGRRVYASSDFRFAVLDDGNGLGAQNTYDHVWDVSGVGSGVYQYILTAKKSGQSDIHKAGRVAIVK